MIGGGAKGVQGIFEEIAKLVGNGALAIATMATKHPEEEWREYRRILKEVGLRKTFHVHVKKKEDAHNPQLAEKVRRAKAVFFTGGDQLRITSELGGTALGGAILDLFQKGGIVIGTSAGASVMSETMLVSGAQEGSPRIGFMPRMAPGLGLAKGMTIDQHFAERGRVGRLIGVVAQNAQNLGVGIDEGTAIVVDQNGFRVIGKGAVYVFDGREITNTNVSEEEEETALSVFDVKLHILCEGDSFNLRTLRPQRAEKRLSVKTAA